jgi:hypothetical protein
MDKIDYLLPKVRDHLVIHHHKDDEMIRGFIRSAIDYAEEYQKVKYGDEPLPPTTELAVIMLSGFFYESRDGATAGFFADYAGAVPNVWATINRLLSLGKRWEF